MVTRSCLYGAGIDVGSRTTKIVVVTDNKILYQNWCDSGLHPKKQILQLLNQASEQIGINCNELPIYATGYGRYQVENAKKQVTEISCHAKGVHYLFPNAQTILDIGGQDAKIVTLGNDGKVIDFVMNDKCAAGTGRFLEVTANILQCTLSELSTLAQQSKKELAMNSVCVVFAESEIVGLLANGEESCDIVKAVDRGIIRRVRQQFSSLQWQTPIVFTGGVAQNSDLVQILGDELQTEVLVPSDSWVTGALGAAILALTSGEQ